MRDGDETVKRVERGIRMDLLIALLALLISSVAAAASWWQARLLVAQTQVLQEQLGAQVWPYVSNEVGVAGNTVKILIRNVGLGPAIIESFSVAVDGTSQPTYTAILHALLGENLVARSPAGDKIAITMDSGSPGMIMRASEDATTANTLGFTVTSKHFSVPLLRASQRLSFKICYCSIIPGKCWLTTSPKSPSPHPQTSCPEDTHDLLHASAVVELTNRNF